MPKGIEKEALSGHKVINGGDHVSNLDLQEDIRMIKSKVLETTDAITNTAKDVKSKAEELLQDSINDVRTKSANLEESVIEYIIENPLKAVGYSVLAGALLALFLRRK
ncbi:hypothetical protein BH10PSE19_BH10PSE19_00510 [soil metagenome]